jgi:hypothetical protein
VAGAGFALALAAAVAVTTEPAGAAFSAPVDLSDSQDAMQPEIASDADGDAVAVWSAWDGSDPRVQARTISADGFLGPIRTLSDAGQHARYPQVASDSNGGAIVVWWRNLEIQARTISAASDLGPVETLATHTLGDHPQIASDADGDAIVVWDRRGAIYARTISAAGVVGPSKILSRAEQFAGHFPQSPQVASDAQGDAVAVWIHNLGAHPSPTTSRVEARTISRAGVRGPIKTLSAGGRDAYWALPEIASDARGDAVAVWAGGPNGVDRFLKARMISHTGSLGPIRTLFGRARNRGLPSGEAQIASDADGDAVAVWRGTSARRIQARTISAAGSLGPLRTLSSGGYHGQYQVASDADGDAVAVWSRRSPNFHVYARTISAASVLGATTVLSAGGMDDSFWDPAAEIASDADGSVVAVWQQIEPFEQLFDSVIQASRGP